MVIVVVVFSQEVFWMLRDVRRYWVRFCRAILPDALGMTSRKFIEPV